MLVGYAQAQLQGTGLDPNDFVQETFARGLRAFAATAPPGRPEAYLMKVLQNLLCTEFRKQVVKEKYESDPVLQSLLLASPANEAEPLLATRLSALPQGVADAEFARAIQSLRPKLREPYELHLQGLSNAEIAGDLGLKPGVVAQRLCYARKDIREALRRASKEYES